MDYLKLIKEKGSEMDTLFRRMDDDANLYRLESFVMKDSQRKAVPNVINITLNDAQTDADRIIALLTGATIQAEVEGAGLTDDQTTLIEDFLSDISWEIEDNLAARQFPPMITFISQQICLRGRLAMRYLQLGDKKRIRPSLLLADARNVLYDIGGEGLAWIAHKTLRSKTLIEQEYGEVIASNYGTVTDFWDDKMNIVDLNGQKIREDGHKMGYPPWVYVQSGLGSAILDDKTMEYSGESVYAPNRHVLVELNRFASILATLTQMSFQGALQYKTEHPELIKEGDIESPYGLSKITPVPIGGGFDNVPVADIARAAQLFYSILEGRRQRGGLPTIDYGNLQFPLSGAAVGRLVGRTDLIFLPRIQALAVGMQQLSRMMIQQYIENGRELPIGERGRKYRVRDLDKRFTIKYTFYRTSPEEDILKFSMAAAAKGYISDNTARRDILKLQNPDGERELIEIEQAEAMHPPLFFYRRATALIKQGKPLEAFTAAQKMVQLVLAEIPQPQPPQPSRKPMLPLLAEAGSIGARKAEMGVVAPGNGQQPEE